MNKSQVLTVANANKQKWKGSSKGKNAEKRSHSHKKENSFNQKYKSLGKTSQGDLSATGKRWDLAWGDGKGKTSKNKNMKRSHSKSQPKD